MRNCVIWCVVLLAIAGTACSKGSKPSEQGNARQEGGAGGKTEGPPREIVVDLGGGVKMEFVLIPAGGEPFLGSSGFGRNAGLGRP